VLVERIFSYEGIGNMAIDAVINRDFPLIQGLILTFAALFIGSSRRRPPGYAARSEDAPWLTLRSMFPHASVAMDEGAKRGGARLWIGAALVGLLVLSRCWRL